MLRKSVPQILINREPLHHLNFDIELLGDCDVIINEILHRLGDGWNQVCQSQIRLRETQEMPDTSRRDGAEDTDRKPETLGESSQHLGLLPKKEKTEEGVEASGDLDKAKEQDQEFAETPPLLDTLKNEESVKSEAHATADIADGKLDSDPASRKDNSLDSCVQETKDSSLETSVDVSRTSLESRGDDANRTPDAVKLEVSVESATSAALVVSDTNSCLNGKLANANSQDIEGNSASDNSAASVTQSTSIDSSNPSQAFHDSVCHSQDAANQYMQFQRMLDSSANNSSSITHTAPSQPARHSATNDETEIKGESAKVEDKDVPSAVIGSERTQESSNGSVPSSGGSSSDDQHLEEGASTSSSPETSQAPSTSLHHRPKRDTISHYLRGKHQKELITYKSNYH